MKKRLFNFLLIISMLGVYIPNTTAVLAANDGQAYIAEILSQIGIADEEVFYFPDKEISRADFAILAAGLRGYKGDRTDQTSFLDMNREHYASDYVQYLTSLSILDGYDDYTFRGEQIITYGEAAKIIVKMLGYEIYAEMAGGWQSGYSKIAADLGINKGMAAGAGGKLTQKQAIRMIYNALDKNICTLQMQGGTDFKFVTDKGETPMSEWLKIEKTTGLVTSVGEATILHDSAEKNTLTVNGQKLYLSQLDVAYTLGYYCEIYYYADDSEDAQALAAVAVLPDRNDVTVINARNVVEYKDGYLRYYTDTRDFRVRIDAISEVALNGSAVKSEDREAALTTSNGTIIYNKISTGDIRTVVMIIAYDTYVIGGLNTSELMVYDKLDATRQLNLNPDNGEVSILDEDGSKLAFSNLAVDDVLTVQQNAAKDRTTVIRSSVKVPGEFLNYDKVEEYDITYIVDGKKYQLARDYIKNKKSDPSIGEKIRIYLDSYGDIAFIAPEKSTDFQYGFLCKIVADETEDMVFNIKLYLRTGVFARYFTIDKLKIDGERPKTPEGVIESLQQGTGGATTYQLVRFKLNSEGKIIEIDTAYRGIQESANTLRIMYRGYTDTGVEKEKLVYKPDNSFEHKVLYTSGTTTWMTAAKDYEGNENVFKLGKKVVNGYSYAFNAYCAGENQLYPDVMLSYSMSADDVAEQKYGVIKAIEKTINADDEPVITLVTGTKAGGDVSYTTTGNYLLDDVLSINLPNSEIHKIKVGDFVQLSLNVLEQVVGMKVIYDCENQRWASATNPWGSFHNDNISGGTAYKKDGSVLQIALDGAALGNNESKFADMLRIYALGTAKMYVYDSSIRKVSNGSINEINGYYDSGYGASRVVILCDGGKPELVVVYR